MDINADSFMQESFDLGELDTKLDPIPEGEHVGQIGTGDKDVDIETGSKNDKPWMRATIYVILSDPNLLAAMKREEPVRARYQFFVDLHEGRIDRRPQRNVKLGALRAAVGQNKPGEWKWENLKGQPIRVTIKQEKSKDDPDVVYSNIVKLAKAS